MSQNDLVINNQSFPATRADINSALQALGSLNSGATAPSTTYANMLWYDTATNYLKMRSEANDAWITVGLLDQSANTFSPAGVSELTQGQVEDDTSTVFGQVSGQRLAQAVAANASAGGLTRYSLFTASGTFNAPADAAAAIVFYTGGGGGGGKTNTNDSTNSASDGGSAGFGFKFIDLTPSSANTIVIGAGGAGVTANSGDGTAGGSTTCFGLTATGGGRGRSYVTAVADGTASSSFAPVRNDLAATYGLVDAPDANKTVILQMESQGATTSAAAVAYVESGAFQAGFRGTAGRRRTNSDGTAISDVDAFGGVGGFVAVWY
jgi:hypothetical protein